MQISNQINYILIISHPNLKETGNLCFSTTTAALMVLKLYGVYRSPCVRLVAAILVEKQVPFVLVSVDFITGEQKSAKYLAKHPYGQVPCIVCNSLFILVCQNNLNMSCFGTWLGRRRVHSLRKQSHMLLYSVKVCWSRDTATSDWDPSQCALPASCVCRTLSFSPARHPSCKRNTLGRE